MSFDPVVHDTNVYQREIDRATEQEYRVELCREEARNELFGCPVFVSEKIGDSRALAPMLAALQTGDDAEAGRVLRSILTDAADEEITDVAREISHGGDLDEMIRWWRE